jgi:hypothetical protein
MSAYTSNTANQLLTTFTAAQINNRACELVVDKKYSDAFELYKVALSQLQREMGDSRRGHLPYTQEQLHRLIHEAMVTNNNKPSSTTALVGHGNHFCSIKSMKRDHATSKKEDNDTTSSLLPHPMDLIYSRPLLVQDGSNDLSLTAFALTFNIAISGHLMALQKEQDGNFEGARMGYLYSRRLYQLPLQQLEQRAAGDPLSRLLLHEELRIDGYIHLAIFNNLSHVHSALQVEDHAQAYRKRLVECLFYFQHTGLVVTKEETYLFHCFMDNVFDVIARPICVAGAA